MRLAVLLVVLAIAAPAGLAGAPFVDHLAAAGRLRIPLDRAISLEAELGQLLVVNVDGFGYSGSLALAPGFAELVERIQVGGVIPHYGSNDIEKIARTNRALAAMTTLPLLICSDIVKLRGPTGIASFGDGYVGGFLGKYRGLPDAELRTLAGLNAFVFAALGINVALGPTVDSSAGEERVVERAASVIRELELYGVAPVLKHWPGLPAGADLHHSSPDTRVREPDLTARDTVFRSLAGEAGIMMTTHFRDSLVDPAIVTFSARWTGILRRQTGFGGLLMTDGILMLRNYGDRAMLAPGESVPAAEASGIDETALWAARAILAGHDMVIVEGSIAQTDRAWAGLLALACSGTPIGELLARRIEESWKRITRWKAARTDRLRRTIDVPPTVIPSIIALLPPEGADLSRFRFNETALARLEPELAAVEVRSATD
jgi:beta-glucosidase-like glycosyl hydrolase